MKKLIPYIIVILIAVLCAISIIYASDLRSSGGATGSGDMTKAVYDPQGKNGDAFLRSNQTGSQSNNTITGLGTMSTATAADYSTTSVANGLYTGIAHSGYTTTAHGGIVASTDGRLTDARTPTTHDNTKHSASYTTASDVATQITTSINAKIGTITLGKWCTELNSKVTCTADAPAGTGDVVGPASSTADAIVLFNGTGGKTIKDSTKKIGTITTGKWCSSADGITIDCTENAPGGGTPITGPGTSVDNELVLFSSTTGSVLKRASSTGTVSMTAGVLSTTTGTGGLHISNGGVPSASPTPRRVWATADQTFSSTTAAASTYITFPVAIGSYTISCFLPTTDTTTSAARYAWALPATSTISFYMTRRAASATALTAPDNITAQWASTCTGCTASITTAIAQTTPNRLDGYFTVTAAGTATLYIADSTNAQANVLKKGAWCDYVQH